MALFSYGYQGDKVKFVIFQNVKVPMGEPAGNCFEIEKTPNSNTIESAWLKLPKAMAIDLLQPPDNLVYEINMNRATVENFASAPINCTRDELKEYLDSHASDPPSIAGLQTFLTSQHSNRK